MYDEVLILLATYNGENYVRTMIDSVLGQDYENLRLVLSDDGSKDGTSAILEEYGAKYPDRVVHYRSGMRFGSAQKHFMHLLSAFHDSPYIMFCDQDDYWHPDKVSRTLKLMKETQGDSDLPVLVHTDLRVVDRDLNEIAPSFCRHSALNGNRVELNHLLVNNVVTGCTVMINRSLAELGCREVPMDRIMMHDWWLALIASACGKIAFLDEATIDYRQHGSNSVGAKNVYAPSYLWKRLRSGSMRKSMMGCADQADAFLTCYSDVLSEEAIALCKALSSTKGRNVFYRDKIYATYKLHKNGFIRCVAQYLGW